MTIVRNAETNAFVRRFNTRAEAEMFLNIGNNRNIFNVEA